MKVSKKYEKPNYVDHCERDALRVIQERELGKLGRKCDFLVKTKATFTSRLRYIFVAN
jgi:hypothetical protein